MFEDSRRCCPPRVVSQAIVKIPDHHSLDLKDRAKAIDIWSGRVRRISGPSGGLASHDADMLREELNVAEEELRVQHDEIVLARVTAELEREQYRQLFDHAPVPYVITDPAGTIQAPNTAAAGLFGVDASRLTGKPIAVFLEPDARPGF